MGAGDWWTRGESNPFLLHAMESFYRYTTGPDMSVDYLHETHVSNETYESHGHFRNGSGLTMIPFFRTSK